MGKSSSSSSSSTARDDTDKTSPKNVAMFHTTGNSCLCSLVRIIENYILKLYYFNLVIFRCLLAQLIHIVEFPFIMFLFKTYLYF